MQIWIFWCLLIVSPHLAKGLGFLAVKNAYKKMRSFSEKICMEKPNPGPCEHFRQMWYYSSDKNNCFQFQYGGCMGNRNKFMTKKECNRKCHRKSRNESKEKEKLRHQHRPRHKSSRNSLKLTGDCHLPKERGYCTENSKGAWWWYYNSRLKSCDQFWYSGCGGNHNRFYSEQDCIKACMMSRDRSGLKSKLCQMCDRHTSICVKRGQKHVSCQCKVGFTKNSKGQCIDEDECMTHKAHCSPHAWCQNTVGSYKCVCFAGYKGNGKYCRRIDKENVFYDCKKCHPQAVCERGVCRCKHGFKGDGYFCEDINECMDTVSPCSPNAQCENTQGSFTCTCHSAYAGNGYNCTNSPDACFDGFDEAYRRQCGSSKWQLRFYFDYKLHTCRRFWYGSCQAASRNIFSDLQTCETLCKYTAYPDGNFASACLSPVNHALRYGCHSSIWTEKYYFDQATKTCRAFWYDSCHHGKQKNFFHTRKTCELLCENQLSKKRTRQEKKGVIHKLRCTCSQVSGHVRGRTASNISID